MKAILPDSLQRNNKQKVKRNEKAFNAFAL